MAEAALFSIASKLLSTVASPAFKMAYEKGRSIWEARDELDKLARSIQTIQAVLLDAEKKKEGSAAVRDWIERVSDVLYDAEDLFDEVATDQILKQQIKGDKPLKKVQAYCFKLNPIVSSNSIANKVKAIRKSLLEISNDMAQFEFVTSVDDHEQKTINLRKGKDLGSYVDFKDVIGRDNDKKTIIELLLDDKSNNGEQDVSVIAVVGIGGMGKTTLAQLVYNDKEVESKFPKRWFACISDTTDNTEIIGKIFQSICKKNYGDITLDQQQIEIRESVGGVKFLLVLDDVWDEDRASWQQHRMSLLRSGARGSKIIVTTRSLSVARAMGALETHNLEGLSESESWDLFKKIAFTDEQEKDPRWGNLGREIVKKCANVPLALRSVANILCTKDTIQEWESFKDNELSKVEPSGDSIMQALKLSYDHLPFNLKPCFAYCSMFPKDYIFDMDELIYLWIAHGYIKPSHEKETVEQAGYSYFMDLHRRCFFEKGEDWNGIFKKEYKMHDLIHDLAQCVAQEEIMVLTKPPTRLNKGARHVSIGFDIDTSHMLNTNRLRSLLYLTRRDEVEERQFTYGKYLRALRLPQLSIGIVSSSICELKHLRYLNLSNTLFESLPDSLTNLLNLLTLDLHRCLLLKALPGSFRKLINLRHLNIWDCNRLKHMPPGMRELTCLQNLSHFKVAQAVEGVEMSRLDVLAGLQLRGLLSIEFEREGIDNWDGDEFWKLPVSLEGLGIMNYPGRRIPHWSNHPSLIPNLSLLHLDKCREVKYLPPLRSLPNLKFLILCELNELEYIEEEGDGDNGCTTVAAGYTNNSASFFPVLEKLKLVWLPKLKGWSRRKVEAATSSSAGSASPDLFLSFPLLSRLKIRFCEELTSFPLCPCVRRLKIEEVDGGLVQQFLSAASINPSSLEELFIYDCQGLEYFVAAEAFAFLKICKIDDCHRLESVEVEALPSLVNLEIRGCKQLKSLRIARLNALQEFTLQGYPQELDLWGIQQAEKRCSVDWDSLPNLRELYVKRRPTPEELPNCLGHLEAIGQLQLRHLILLRSSDVDEIPSPLPSNSTVKALFGIPSPIYLNFM